MVFFFITILTIEGLMCDAETFKYIMEIFMGHNEP